MIVINKEIISIKYGESVLPENVVFQGGDKENINIKTFKDEQIVCNGVKIIRIGGHSKGSCITIK